MKLAVVGAGSTYTPEVVDGLVRLRGLLPVDELALQDTTRAGSTCSPGLARRMLDARRPPGAARRRRSASTRPSRGRRRADPAPRRRPGGAHGRRVAAARVRLPRPGDDRLRRPREGAADGAGRARASPSACASSRPTRGSSTSRTRSASSRRRCSTRATAPSGSAARRSSSSGTSRRCSTSHPTAIELDHVGLNHLTWEVGVRLDGDGRAAARSSASTPSRVARATGLPAELVRRLGNVPSYYLHYFYEHDARRRAAPEPRVARGGGVRASSRSCCSSTRTRRSTRSPSSSRGAAARGYSEAAVELLASLLGTSGERPARHQRAERRGAAVPRGRRRRRGAGARRRRRGRGAAGAGARRRSSAGSSPTSPPTRSWRSTRRSAAGASASSARCSPIRSSARRLPPSTSPTHARREQELSPVGVVVGVDGGNSKTELLAATLDGEPLAYLRGPGSNSHGRGGAAGCVEVIAALVDRARLAEPAERGGLLPLRRRRPGRTSPRSTAAIGRARLGAPPLVDNDTFALLRAGTDARRRGRGRLRRRHQLRRALGLAGASRVSRRSGGRPATGAEAETLGREALFLAARAEDGRGEPTALVPLIQSHFGLVRRGRGRGRSLPGGCRRAPRGARAGDRRKRRPRMRSRGSSSSGSPTRSSTSWGALCAISSSTTATSCSAAGCCGTGPLAELVTARLPAGTVPVVLREPPGARRGARGARHGGGRRRRRPPPPRLRRRLGRSWRCAPG